MSKSVWDKMHSDPIVEHDIYLFGRTVFTAGGLNKYGLQHLKGKISDYRLPTFSDRMEEDMNTGRDGFFGWHGYGGSCFQWHPELKIGISYVPGDYYNLDQANRRSAKI